MGSTLGGYLQVREEVLSDFLEEEDTSLEGKLGKLH